MSTTPASSCTVPVVSRSRLRVVDAAVVLGASRLIWLPAIATLALVLRAWNISAAFASSDQVAMAHLVRHSYGIKWLFAHDYGPTLAVLQRTFAEILSRLGLPIAEASARIPVMLISLAQVALTFPLLRRLRCPRTDAIIGTLCCAALPMMVVDAHYAWAYLAVWLLTGSLAIWATLAYFDDRRPWQLLLATLALFAHCLSNCYAFALPLTLLLAWTAVLKKRSQGEPDRTGSPGLYAALVGFVLPCLAALAVILLSWLWTDGGQMGRLLTKHQAGTSEWHLMLLADWWALWIRQFGYLFVAVATSGMVFGGVLIARKDRRGLLAIWAWGGIVPLILLADPSLIGHAGAYLIEAVYGGALLGTVLICSACRRLAQRRYGWARTGIAVMAALALCHMTVGGADDCLAGGRLHRLTGIHTGWGNVKPDTGIKAASWYVRQHVPLDATIMTLHTNHGMEVPVAEYYIGRNVLAGYDFPPEILEPLVHEMREIVDVVIVPARCRSLVAALDEFDCVCTLTREGEPVRFIYARPALSLPKLQEEVAAVNPRYDHRFQPRHVPIALSAPPGFEDKFGRYQLAVRRLKTMHSACSSP